MHPQSRSDRCPGCSIRRSGEGRGEIVALQCRLALGRPACQITDKQQQEMS
jgi:hypothetical protein